ncbi:Large subunit GTPase 1 [Zancudomyces culisetae]|uniref:Large subunit GTPase 1 n=1 Tax=Zancudomyces culisetae TaxID=1213189 RepID=A0A1R1PZH3_ZANCU|nr:Large subunit GTPase 1 [Zancudomyces culisetae]|eukprot:OMH86361.1 Large subunit GTPase 1 [Zancudomyces culisetae]
MPPRHKANNSGLGRAVIRKRFEGQRKPVDGEVIKHTTELDDGAKWVKMQSITQQGDLEEFLHTAQLADKDFTAEKRNVKIISKAEASLNGGNLFLLSKEEERQVLEKHKENKSRLKVPRRPKWTKETTADELHKMEREDFLEWRRELAMLQEQEGLLLTPYERNIEVWRQLWRVLERSQIVVQIVDARNPLLFRCEDLEVYCKEIDPHKKCYLLINKADLLTEKQREYWADYFEKHNIEYMFFSAKEAVVKQTEEQELLKQQLSNSPDQEAAKDQDRKENIDKAEEELEKRLSEIKLTQERARTSVLSPEELVSVLKKSVFAKSSVESQPQNRVVIGLVGYPNVGKSSTINALLGSKKVSVGSMPGKTKHFQTILLTENIMLCDCPGLVFPTFATTKADMVINGVLPIDQLTEYTGPAALVAQRIPAWVIEATYGISVFSSKPGNSTSSTPTGEDLLVSFAAARGLTKSGQGNPDESRAARIILKDYVTGKLLYTHPPPSVDAPTFNAELFDQSQFLKKNSKNFIDPETGSLVVHHPASNRQNVTKVLNSSLLSSSNASTNTAAEIDSSFFIDSLAATNKGNISSMLPKFKGQKQGYKSAVTSYKVDNSGNALPVISNVENAISMAQSIKLSSADGSTTSSSYGKNLRDPTKNHKKGKKNIKVRSGSIYS